MKIRVEDIAANSLKTFPVVESRKILEEINYIQRHSSLNNGHTLDRIKKIANQDNLYIYNVGPETRLLIRKVAEDAINIVDVVTQSRLDKIKVMSRRVK